jgi:hypothetical protein
MVLSHPRGGFLVFVKDSERTRSNFLFPTIFYELTKGEESKNWQPVLNGFCLLSDWNTLANLSLG